MRLWQLIFREIGFRKTNFIIGLACVAVAIACFAGSVTLLRAHEIRTEQILSERERATREEMKKLEDDYRLIMRELGYNVMVLHSEQSLASLRAKGHPDVYMPEEYVHKLGRGNIETLNHLLPVLQQKITWHEYDIEIILSGTPGQVPVLNKSQFLTPDMATYRNPIMHAIPQGKLLVGHGVARELKLREGGTVALNGEEFQILRINPPEGSIDDITVWCELSKVQQWLSLEGKINAILALECICNAEKVGKVAADVHNILPDTQGLEYTSRIIPREKARSRAAEAHRKAIDAEIVHRAEIGRERRALASILVPVVMTASAVWVFFLVSGNVRERRSEIGILRALGVGQAKIVGLFLVKAIVIGLSGAIIGFFIGTSAGAYLGEMPLTDFAKLFDGSLFVAAVVLAAALCAIAGWLPAMRAARLDPAVVLRED